MIVLNYHRLCAGSPTDSWSLSCGQFDAHTEVFRPELISPETFLARCHEPAFAQTSHVLLTFDDGCESDYTYVFPRFAGTAGPGFMSFIVTDFVGQPGHLDWQMIEEMDRHGVVIGSHGVHHTNLTRLAPDQLDQEIHVSKSILEDHLGRRVTHFAFPYGRFNRRVWEAALRAGYTHLFTIQLGHHNGFEPFLLSRLCVTNSMDTHYLRRHLHDPCGERGLAWRISSSLGLYRPAMQLRYR
jgi:peptidoglycan/xylan/chitin deacetylase (PgdA/CDA1 family)